MSHRLGKLVGSSREEIMAALAEGASSDPADYVISERRTDRLGDSAILLSYSLEFAEPDLPATFDLNDVVSLHLRRGGEREGLYSRILRILRDARPAPSGPLLALAGIPGLDLFVSLTFDSLLAKAIAQARPGAVPQPGDTAPQPA